MTSQPVLFELAEITAYCFFGGTCAYRERGDDPQTVHDVMEEHYRVVHASDIERIVRWLR